MVIKMTLRQTIEGTPATEIHSLTQVERSWGQMMEREFPKLFSTYNYWWSADGLIIVGTIGSCKGLAMKVLGQILTIKVDRGRSEKTARSTGNEATRKATTPREEGGRGPQSPNRTPGIFSFPVFSSFSLNPRKTVANYYDGELTIIIPRERTDDVFDPREADQVHDIEIITGPLPAPENYPEELVRLLVLAGFSRVSDTPHPEQSSYGTEMVEDDRIITRGGNRYLPVSLAADLAQVPRTTLLNWMKAKVKFQGRPLQTYYSQTARRTFLKEESVERVRYRFVKWPSKQPVGQVIIGETGQQTGYIGITKAARAVGVDHHTIWLWITRGNAPTEKPLDVIRCSASDQFYIHEKDVSELKKLIPRSGLQKGRRPRQSLRPA